MAAIFPDNTVLCNFAAIDRLDLLEGWLRGRGRWTDAVARETRKSARVLPSLTAVFDGGWLDEPIDYEHEQVERIRTTVFGGSPSEPTKHLGEAVTCVLILREAEFQGSWWISDDADAYEYASGRGITTRRTIDVMREIVADGDLTAQQAFTLMQRMATEGRHLVLPAQPRDLQ